MLGAGARAAIQLLEQERINDGNLLDYLIDLITTNALVYWLVVIILTPLALALVKSLKCLVEAEVHHGTLTVHLVLVVAHLVVVRVLQHLKILD